MMNIRRQIPQIAKFAQRNNIYQPFFARNSTVNQYFLSQKLRYYSTEGAAETSFLTKEEVQERILNVIKKHEKVDPEKVGPEAHFVNDLGLDSLDATEVVMEVENEFGIEIPDDEAFKLQSVSDCVKYISANPTAK